MGVTASRPGGAAPSAQPARRFSPIRVLRSAFVLRGRRPPEPGYKRLSLYWRVVIVNALVLVLATTLLATTPAHVSLPGTVEDAIVLVAGLAVVIVTNAVLLRVTFKSLAGLAAAMRSVDLLKPGARLRRSGGVEVRQVIGTFNEMLDRLERERTQSNRRAHLAREAERRRIGRELHDEVGQRLTGILLQLERTRTHLPPELRDNLARTQELVRSTLDEIGAIAWRLRPGILDDLGLAKALEALVQSVSDPARVRILLGVAEPLPALGPDAEIVLYRVAQEGLTNALRHARATEIRVELRPQDGGVHLEVVDDGCGLAATDTEGEGLRGMRERALSIGGHLQIESRAADGVRISLDIVPPAAVD